MKTLICTCICYLLMIAPLLHAAAKPAKKTPAVKKAEFCEKKVVEKVKDKGRSKGTNIVWKTGREFPLMFSRPQKNPSKKDPK